MKNKIKYLSLSILITISLPIVYSHYSQITNVDNEQNNKYLLEKNNNIVMKMTDQEFANSLKISNPDSLKTRSVDEIYNILKTQIMTKKILDLLSITQVNGLDPSKVSFNNFETGNLFIIKFTIYYNGIPKLNVKDFLNATPTDQDVVNKILVTNPNILVNKEADFIIRLLNSKPMTQDILNLLSISIPKTIEPSLISFVNIKSDSFQVNFTIQYKTIKKLEVDFLNINPTKQEIANSLKIQNNNSVNNLNDIQIIDLLNEQMTDSILAQLSIKIDNKIIANKITFNIIKHSLFKVEFIICYDGFPKEGVHDFLNASISNQDIANKIIIDNPNIMANEKIDIVKKLLVTNPMTQEILDKLSIIIPEGADPSKVSIKIINSLTPIKVVFIISYNNVPKTRVPDFLNVLVTNLQIANAIKIQNESALIKKNVTEIRTLLRTNPMTQVMLNQLSIIIPEGADPSRVSIENINITNLFQVTFRIKYKKTFKEVPDILKATPTNQEIANNIFVEDQNILMDKTGTEVQNLLKSKITEKLLNDLTIKIPIGTDFSKVSFSEIKNINGSFKVSFVINYNGIPKEGNPSFFVVTLPSDQSIANAIVIQNENVLKKLTSSEIIDLLERPMTSIILKKLDITIPTGVTAAKISFDNFETLNLFKVFFTIKYNGIPKIGNQDFFNSTPKDEEIANAIKIENSDIVKNQSINFVNGLMATKPMTQEILDKLSIKIPLGGDASKVSFTNIDISNPFKISFKINYNNTSKKVIDSLMVYATSSEIANSIVINDKNVLKMFTVEKIKEILETKPMTQEILDKLSIKIPKELDITKISFTKIDISNKQKVIFTITYDGTLKYETDFLNASSLQEIVNNIKINNNKIVPKTSQEVAEILKTNPMTIEILNQLSISIPSNVDVSKITFTNVTIDLFKITFKINYLGVIKNGSEFIKTTPLDSSIAFKITSINPENLIDKDAKFITKLLNTKPMTIEILNQLSISIPMGADPSKITFRDINIKNNNQISFVVYYNGAAGNKISIKMNPSPNLSNTALITSLSTIGIIVLITTVGIYIWWFKKKKTHNNKSKKQSFSISKNIINKPKKKNILPVEKTIKKSNYQEYSNIIDVSKNSAKILKPTINKPNNKSVNETNKWHDNKWYNDKSETGEWNNGKWLSNEEIDRIINTKSKKAFEKKQNISSNDDWDDIFKITEN